MIKKYICFLLLSTVLLSNLSSQNEDDVTLDAEVELDVPNITSSTIGDFRTGLFRGFKYKGKIIIPFEYAELPRQLAPIMFAKKEQNKVRKSGFISSKNEVIIPFIYDELPYEYADFMIAKKGEKKGLIDSNGVEIIPFEYENIYSIPFKKDTYIAVNSDDIQEFDTKKNKQKSEYTYYKDYLSKKIISIGKQDGFFGVIDYQNQEVLPFDYDCPLEYFRKIDNVSQWKTCKNGKYGIIDANNQSILAFKYENVEETGFTDWFKIFNGNKEGVVDAKGKIIVPAEFDEIGFSAFNRGNLPLAIVTKDQRKGVFNGQGQIIVPIEFDNIKFIENKYIKVQKDDLFGLYNAYGNKVLPCEFDKNIKYKSGYLHAHRKGERMGQYTDSGKLIPKKKFDFQQDMGDYILVAEDNVPDAKKGLMDKVGNVIAEPIYDSITFQKNAHQGVNYLILEKEGKFDFFVDALFPTVSPFTQFGYDNLAFGIWKKDKKDLEKQGHDLNHIIGYTISSDTKKRTYITVKLEEITVE